MEPFIRVNINNEDPARYELTTWQDNHIAIRAGFTGRSGGLGSGSFESFNLALHVGDDPDTVIANRKRLAEALEFSFDQWTCGEQVHSHRVALVSASDAGRGRIDRTDAFQGTDGLLTDEPGVLLTSFYADCVPLYFWDPVRSVVGLAHAGWKGTVQNIAGEMVRTMKSEYGCKEANIHAAIGPSIGACCYEVDETVMGQVRACLVPDLHLEQLDKVAEPSHTPDKSKLDLKELNRILMRKAGILPSHIECSRWCTSCHSDRFFSYRKENGVTGRMASWIGMKER